MKGVQFRRFFTHDLLWENVIRYFGVAPLGHSLFTKTMIISLEMKRTSI